MTKSAAQLDRDLIEHARQKLVASARAHVAAGKGPESAARAAIRETQTLFPAGWKLAVQGDDDDPEVEIWEVDHQNGDEPIASVSAARPKRDPGIGDRFDYFGRVFEIIKIGRDKKKTLQLARRVRDNFGKAMLIDHTSCPAGELERRYFRPVDGLTGRYDEV